MSSRKHGRQTIALILVLSLSLNLLLGIWVVTNYAEVNRLIKVVSLIKTRSLEPATSAQMLEGVIRGVVASLNDPYSTYLGVREYEDLMIHIQGSFGGLGVLVGIRDNRLTVGAPPFKDTPAERAGLRSGDIIVQIDERKTDGMDIDTAIALMRGEPGTKVRLSIERAGQEELLEVTLTREIINLPSVQSRILEEDPRIGYVRLVNFSASTAEDLNDSLEELQHQKIKGVVLDLRNNGGGDFEICLEVARRFVPQGPVVRVIGRNNQEEIFEAEGGFLGLPLVVLVNDLTASASEIVAGAIKDRATGTLVGTRTFGKGRVQAVFPLTAGTGVKLTTHKYLTPGGHDIDQKGIAPDIEVKMSPDSPKDLQLQKAIEVLKFQI